MAPHGAGPDPAADFEPCHDCGYDLVTDEGERGCHYYTCPYLPEQLDVHCPRCNYNFLTDETEPACGTTASCDFAQDEAPERVQNVRAWVARRVASAG